MKTYTLTNAQVVEYLYRRERIKDGRVTPPVERNRLRLVLRRLVYFGRGVVVPIDKERNSAPVESKTTKGRTLRFRQVRPSTLTNLKGV